MRPRHAILGNEFAGEVAAVGRAVTTFAVGDRVFGYDDGRWGAHAQYRTARASASLARIPASLGYEQVARPRKAPTTRWPTSPRRTSRPRAVRG